MIHQMRLPAYLFETSWEVCNKVGGIYTVLSTRAKTLQSVMTDRIIFIGPDLWKGKENTMFSEDKGLLESWSTILCSENIHTRIGRWNIPGNPVVILVDFSSYYSIKNEIYGTFWKDFQVDSLHAYGDYDEASMFSFAAGKVVECLYRNLLKTKGEIIYQAHEWMSGMGMLYLRKHAPGIATIFTTHATSIGRSIAGNDKPLYDYFNAYDGDQMARELNMEAKHSIEKQTAHYADCFTTVSEITNRECLQLLGRKADVILMNGFEADFVPAVPVFQKKRKQARSTIINVANKLMGVSLDDNTVIISTSGRNDFRCKGFDVFLEAMARLNREQLSRDVLALIEVPCWVKEPRKDLLERLKSQTKGQSALNTPLLTHWLYNMDSDRILNLMKQHNLWNTAQDKVKVLLVPCYMDGNDGIFNMHYYDLLIGNDLCIYPSYYEPWGYTPLESVAFKIPCITTNLSGFGLWVNQLYGYEGQLSDGVCVIPRTDSNYFEVAEKVKNSVLEFMSMTPQKVTVLRKKAADIANKALWKNFILYYYEAYQVAMENAAKRLCK